MALKPEVLLVGQQDRSPSSVGEPGGAASAELGSLTAVWGGDTGMGGGQGR